MSSSPAGAGGGVHRRRPSLLIPATSSMNVPSLSGASLQHTVSSGAQQLSSSPQSSLTPTAGIHPSAATAAGGSSSRRRRASSAHEPAPNDGGAGGSTPTGRAKKGGRRSTGHLSEHALPGTAYLPPPAEQLTDTSAGGASDASSAHGPSSTSLLASAPLNPYFPSPPHTSPSTPSYGGPHGYGPALRNPPAGSGRKAPLLQTLPSSSSTAVYTATSPTRSIRTDDLIPLSPGSGYLPSHASSGAVYGRSGGGEAHLPPYSVNAASSGAGLLPSLPLSSSAGPSGFNTAYQTAQTSPSLAVSLTMEESAGYPVHSRFFDSTPSSPRPSTSTDETEGQDHGHGFKSALYAPARLEKLLPTRDDVREKASEWQRWWKRRNSRSFSTAGGGRPGGLTPVATTGSLADRKKRRKRAGTGVSGGLGSGDSTSRWRRLKPERKRGYLFAFLLTVFLLWKFVEWMFWVFNPDKVRIEYRPQCISPHPSYHSLSPLSPDILQSIPLPSLGSPFPVAHPLLPEPLLAPSSLEADKLPPAGVFVGVFSMDRSFERRMLIRSTWASSDVWRGKQGEGLESVRVRFILGRPKPKWEELVRIEMETYGDIVILEVPENMNSGKTHDYFSWASDNALVPAGKGKVGERKPDYVVKSDDDSFVMLGELEKRLRVLRGRKVYWGYLIKNLFMGGECYALSLDLVHYVATSAPVRTLVQGAEDKLVARWMRLHPEKEKILWVSEACWIYDHPRAGTVYSHGFLYPATAREIQQELLTIDDGVSAPGGDGSAHAALKAGAGASSDKTTTTTTKGKKKADSLSYTSVSQFRKPYRPPLPNMTPLQRVEALIEGSEMSLLSPYSSVPDTSPLLPETVMARRPSIDDRYLGMWKAGRWGTGTVVVHYVKEREWFLETALAFERLGGGMGDEAYLVREGRKVETVHEAQHVAGLQDEDRETSKKRAADPLPVDEETSVDDGAQDALLA